MGITGIGYPEALGGTPADIFFHIAAAEEIARAGCGGVQASLGSHGIALPPIVAHGSDALQASRRAAGARAARRSPRCASPSPAAAPTSRR